MALRDNEINDSLLVMLFIVLRMVFLDIIFFGCFFWCFSKRQATAACNSSHGIASLELRLI